jgi:hypothetical protein
MAFRHGRFAEISIASVALSTFCDTADLAIDIDTADTTTFGSTWKTHVVGTAGGSIDGGGAYDPTATTGPASALSALIGADPVAVVLEPGGDVAGQIRHSFNASLTSYAESSSVGDKVAFSFSLLVDGAISTTNIGA